MGGIDSHYPAQSYKPNFTAMSASKRCARALPRIAPAHRGRSSDQRPRPWEGRCRPLPSRSSRSPASSRRSRWRHRDLRSNRRTMSVAGKSGNAVPPGLSSDVHVASFAPWLYVTSKHVAGLGRSVEVVPRVGNPCMIRIRRIDVDPADEATGISCGRRERIEPRVRHRVCRRRRRSSK